ncbi:ribose ABC transporter permease [Bacillus sp. V33-4]|nr:ribose ABC transporter permease [Bacillus sp. V33-4]
MITNVNLKKTSNQKIDLKKFPSQNSALIALITLFIIAIITCGSTFLNANNIINILRNNSIIGIIALGMTLIIIIGGIDLSVGSQLALTGLVTISVINATQSIVLGIIAGIATSSVCGAITGGLVSKFSIPAFIVTLGTMIIYRSISQYFFNGGGIMVSGEVSQAFISISNTDLFGIIPMPIIYWLGLSIMIGFFTKYIATGRHIYAVGSNEKATMLSGIQVNKIKVIVFTVSGLLVSLAAIIEASRLGSINSASSGSTYEMDAIAAAVIGGTSMSGGRGKIINTVFGTLTLGIINNSMNLLGVPPFLVGAVKGTIIIVAVLLQKRLNNDASI